MRVCLLVGLVAMVPIFLFSEWGDYGLFMASNYNFQAWNCSSRTNYTHVVDGSWEFPSLSLATNGMSLVCVSNDYGNLKKLVLVDTNADAAALDVDVLICTNILSAHEAIIDRFSLMTTTVMHQMVSNGIGDVCFVYPIATGAVSAVIFARNNMFVSVDSYLDNVSATNVACQIDHDILTRSQTVAP